MHVINMIYDLLLLNFLLMPIFFYQLAFGSDTNYLPYTQKGLKKFDWKLEYSAVDAP